MISDDGFRLALIPGISIVSKNHPSNHSFLQVIYGNKPDTEYLQFPLHQFRFERNKFQISVGDNTFNASEIHLNIENESLKLDGTVTTGPWAQIPVSITSPGIMGWYTFVPFMQCYHGIVSMDHTLMGRLHINGKKIDFTDGRGYIEKDWGRSFPRSYIWMQSNHFGENGNSFMLSIADIPWLNSFFIGFLSVLKVGNSYYRFATYTGAKINFLDIENELIFISIENKHLKLEVKGHKKARGSLSAPVTGDMQRIIKESLDSVINVKLINKKSGEIIHEDMGTHSGMEIAGDMDHLMNNYRK